ncbi:unnamed protein product [Sphenostylis stenocarpa]|uniref:Uncharacterized protein n=1 Tax=Sphenostylis stenocarpa TaxID=92480 RepID=A0AA86W6L1_9FABA|nr:unnamed protein product [Sphenostylis stenocarpa]
MKESLIFVSLKLIFHLPRASTPTSMHPLHQALQHRSHPNFNVGNEASTRLDVRKKTYTRLGVRKKAFTRLDVGKKASTHLDVGK